jgi:hypothetical protein
MEEVIGSIPIRSTKYFKHLQAHPFLDLADFCACLRHCMVCVVAEDSGQLCSCAP